MALIKKKGIDLAKAQAHSFSLFDIFNEFRQRQPKKFAALFGFLLLEVLAASAAVLSLIPLANYIMDPTLSRPNQLTSVLVDLLKSQGFAPSFWPFATIFIVFNLLKGFLDVGIRYAVVRVKTAAVYDLFSDTLGAFFAARWEFFTGSKQGHLIATLTREMTAFGEGLGALAQSMTLVVQLAVYMAIPFWLDARLALSTVIFAVIFVLPFMLLQKLSYRLGEQNVESYNSWLSILTETLGSARLVIGFGRQKEALMRFLSAFSKHSKITTQFLVLQSAVPSLYRPLGLLAAMLALGLALDAGGNLPELAAAAWSILAALPVSVVLVQNQVTLRNFIPSYEQIMRLKALAESLKEESGHLAFVGPKEAIHLKHLSFTYPGRSQTLDNINISLPAGKMTAIVGSSGAGKSTIADLLLGLQVPGSGGISIDNMAFSDIDLNDLRQHAGYVPQEPVLFIGSIRDNLLWSTPTATESEMWEALRLANAADFVQALPEGLDTLLGDRGINLSGGQKQRLALSRALLRNPQILILDEATSSLDSESEALIQEAIGRISGKTILVIAHRLATVVRADRIYVMQGGRVIEHGSYEDLTAQAGVFSKMVSAQGYANAYLL